MKHRRLFQFPWRNAPTIHRDVDDELRFHLDARTEALIAAGADPERARAQALREFGDVDEARRTLRRLDRRTAAAGRRRTLLAELRQDAAFTLRQLRAAPAFTATALLTLALGLGANVAIFSVVRDVLLRPLPFPDPDQLFQVWSSSPSGGLTQAGVSPLDVDDWRAGRRLVADLGGYWYAAGGSGVDLTGEGEPEHLSAVFVTPGLFTTLGVLPELGRLPREDELVRGGPDRVAVLTRSFWLRKLAGDPNATSRTLTIDGEPYRVLGVMPEVFRFPAAGVDLYLPYSSIPDDDIPRLRQVRLLEVVARARSGVTLDQVRAELNAIAARLAEHYPENAAWGFATTLPLHQALTGAVRPALLVLLGAVGLVLLIACANVASLFLVRATARGEELAMRAALGAGRARLVRQLLTESCLLAFAGGLLGLVVAAAVLAVLPALGAAELPRALDARLDGRLLLLASILSLVAGAGTGLLPAWRSTARNGYATLRGGGRAITESNRLRSALVVAEVALAMMLLVGGALMTRSFLRLLRLDPGFEAEGRVVLNMTLSDERHADYLLTYQQIIDRVRALPGVLAAGAIKDAPLRGVGEGVSFTPPGALLPAGEEPPIARILHVSSGLFHALGARLLEGRDFTPADRRGAPLVVVVNQAFARRWFAGQPAVGQALAVGGDRTVEIVGLVADIRQRAIAEPAEPTVYIHNLQNGRVRMNLVVHTRGEPLAAVGALRDAVWEVDRQQTITEIFTMGQTVHAALARPRLLSVLLGVFGGFGLLLGVIGLYGVLAYQVSQRRREIGLRLALGSTRAGVVSLVLGQGLVIALAGVALGAGGAIWLGRFMAGVLYGVAPHDARTLLSVAFLLIVVATLASLLPARRAARLDPMAALRQQ